MDNHTTADLEAQYRVITDAIAEFRRSNTTDSNRCATRCIQLRNELLLQMTTESVPAKTTCKKRIDKGFHKKQHQKPKKTVSEKT